MIAILKVKARVRYYEVQGNYIPNSSHKLLKVHRHPNTLCIGYTDIVSYTYSLAGQSQHEIGSTLCTMEAQYRGRQIVPRLEPVWVRVETLMCSAQHRQYKDTDEESMPFFCSQALKVTLHYVSR